MSIDKKLMRQLFASAFAVLLLALTATPARSQEAVLRLPPSKKIQLPNGMTVHLMEQREVPIISFNLRLRAGSTADPAGKEGTAALTADLLRRGTRARTADQISAELDFIGGQFDTAATHDATVASAEFLKKDIAKGLELFTDILLDPTFPTAEFTKLQRQNIDSILAAKDQPQAVIGTYFNAYLFGTHPYARPTSGSESTLAAVTRDDVAKFYASTYAPANAILAVVGDFNTSEMEGMITKAFGRWNTKPQAATKTVAPVAAKGTRLLLIDKPDATQTFFRIGNVGVARTNKDRIAIDLINTLFGGRFTSRLNSELRIKTGLTYGARSGFDQRLAPGPFFISTYTRNETTEQAIDKTFDVLKQLHAAGITADELQSAKTYLKGQFPPDIETSDQLAALLTELEFYGLSPDEINTYYAQIDRLTLTDARRIIRDYFPTNDYVLVLIGKRSEIEKVARKYAPTVDMKAISQPGF